MSPYFHGSHDQELYKAIKIFKLNLVANHVSDITQHLHVQNFYFLMCPKVGVIIKGLTK